MFNEIEGDLIELSKKYMFDVIAQGNNCFCVQGAGIAPQFVKAFNTNDPIRYPLEHDSKKGEVNKMGTIQYVYTDPNDPTFYFKTPMNDNHIAVVNCYTQYGMGSHKGDLDYEALTLCMRKIGAKFPGERIGLPLIGCGLAGGDWNVVKAIIQKELHHCDVTIVHYKP